MKLLILSDQSLLDELKALPFDDQIQLTWIQEADMNQSPGEYDAVIDLLYDGNFRRIEWLIALNTPLVIVNELQEPVNEKFIRINGWNTFLQRSVIEAVSSDVELRNNVEILFSKLGRSVQWVPDITGMISARVVCAIINEAFFSLEEGVSTAPEIDIAMKMGTNYPFGPFEWGEKIGWKRIFSLMKRLENEEQRYKPSSLLKQAALA